jgi:hypothetical protein
MNQRSGTMAIESVLKALKSAEKTQTPHLQKGGVGQVVFNAMA